MLTYVFDDHLSHFTAVVLICALLVIVCLLKRRIELRELAEERARLLEAIERVHQLSRPTSELPQLSTTTSAATRIGLRLTVSGVVCAAVANALVVPAHIVDAMPYGLLLAVSAVAQGLCGVLIAWASSRRVTLACSGVVLVAGLWLFLLSLAVDNVASVEEVVHLLAGALALVAAGAASALLWRRDTAASRLRH